MNKRIAAVRDGDKTVVTIDQYEAPSIRHGYEFFVTAEHRQSLTDKVDVVRFHLTRAQMQQLADDLAEALKERSK